MLEGNSQRKKKRANSQLSVNAGHMDDPLSETQSPDPAAVDEGKAEDAVDEADDTGGIDD